MSICITFERFSKISPMWKALFHLAIHWNYGFANVFSFFVHLSNSGIVLLFSFVIFLYLSLQYIVL